MTLGIIYNANGYGGIQNQICLLALKFAINSKNIYVFTRNPDSSWVDSIKSPYIHIIPLTGNLLKEYHTIIQNVRKYNITILQVHTFNASIKYRFIKVWCFKTKMVFRVHTYVACSWIPSWKKKMYYLVDSLTSKLVDHYIINGQYLVKEFESKTFISSRKFTEIIDGTYALDSNPSICNYNQLSDKLNLLMIANVIPHKGHDTLIKSLYEFKKKGFAVNCDIIGDTTRNPELFANLKCMIEQMHLESQIKFLGFDKDIKKQVQNHNVVVLPSDSEGTPNCIMEAMSMKRLVVVSDTGGVSEFVQDGVTGFLHAPKDPQNLSETLIRLVNTDVEKLNTICNNAFDYWEKNLSVDAMYVKFLKLYKILCES